MKSLAGSVFLRMACGPRLETATYDFDTDTLMARRKTLAYREPEIIYLVRPCQPGEPGKTFLRAWVANDHSRIDESRPLGNAHFDDEFDLPGGIWYSSRDTDRLYTLPEEVRVGLFEYDDACRAFLDTK